MTAFYDRFERHDRAGGLKAHTTHYCPGCGHGLVHRYLATAIESLGIQDRTVAISPVGCAVFLYYYMDVGHTQAAHGRAPAVALGHKLANPESIVVSYQGDGDLGSIGLAEILHVAQLGLPLTVLFVNNAVYGMTGGQMAPTTLPGQTTTTSPHGRLATMGAPLRVAELIAQLDGPIYVERIALFDAKRRVRAEAVIRKALRLQVENRGFSFIEILAECPLHLKMTPPEAEQWVKEKMLPVFPLGVKKEVENAPIWPAQAPPTFEAPRVFATIGGRPGEPRRFAPGFPVGAHGREVALKLAGAGGDGAQTAALLIARTAIREGFDATHIPSYGPESRGGTSYADVRVAETEVLSPAVPAPYGLVAFNAPSLARFAPTVVEGGVIIYDRNVVQDRPPCDDSVRVLAVPCTDIAQGLGRVVLKNVVALGALHEATRLFPDDSYLASIREALEGKPELVTPNEQAFAAGMVAARRVQETT